MCFRDSISPAASLWWYCTKEIQFMTGFPGLRMDRRCWRMTSAAGGLRHPELKKWLKKCDNWFNVIEEWPLWSWNKKFASLTDPFMQFCPTIWTCVSAKFVLRQLTMDQMECRMMVAGDLSEKVRRTQHFSQRSSLVMSHGCSPTTRRRRCSQQSGTQCCLPDQSNHASSNPRKKWCSLHFLTSTVHHEFIPSGQTVKGHFNVQVLQRLRDAVRRKWRDKWLGEWFLHRNNALSHTSLVVQQFLAGKSIPVITQPPYSPDLAPNDFWLFPTLKMGLNGTRFATMEDIKSNATAKLRKIQKPSASASNNGRIDGASVCAHGSYLEGD